MRTPSGRHRARSLARLAAPPLAALGILILPAEPVRADIPPLYQIVVTPDYGSALLVAPGPLAGTTYTISIRDEYGVPLEGVTVQARFHPAIRVCADAQHLAVTNSEGVCRLELRAGGCVLGSHPDAAVLVANGVTVRVYLRVRSPDNASHSASQPNGAVNVADLAFFAEEFRGAVPAGCHDYTNDGIVSTADLPFFGDAFRAGLACALP